MKREQVLLTLIRLEFLFIVLISGLGVIRRNLVSPALIVAILTFVVGRAAVGLRLLVNCVRSHGSDLYKRFNVV